MEKAVRDSYGRTIEYMRISITDRCNLRCRYCMPDGAKWIPMSEILTYEEIERICREAVRIGITRSDPDDPADSGHRRSNNDDKWGSSG